MKKAIIIGTRILVIAAFILTGRNVHSAENVPIGDRGKALAKVYSMAEVEKLPEAAVSRAPAHVSLVPQHFVGTEMTFAIIVDSNGRVIDSKLVSSDIFVSRDRLGLERPAALEYVRKRGLVSNTLSLAETSAALTAPFAASVKEAFKDWKFSPGESNGVPVAVKVYQSVGFNWSDETLSNPAPIASAIRPKTTGQPAAKPTRVYLVGEVDKPPQLSVRPKPAVPQLALRGVGVKTIWECTVTAQGRVMDPRLVTADVYLTESVSLMQDPGAMAFVERLRNIGLLSGVGKDASLEEIREVLSAPFVGSARPAVRNSQFVPAEKDGVPVAARVQFPVNFDWQPGSLTQPR